MLLSTPAIILPPEKPAIVRASDLSALPPWEDMCRRIPLDENLATFPFPFFAGKSSHGAFVTTASTTFDGSNTVYAGYTVVNSIPASSFSTSGNFVKLRFVAPASGNGYNISSCYIGHPGTAPSFAGSTLGIDKQVVTFGGNLTAAVPIGTSLVTDEIVFAFDKTKGLLIAIDFAASPGSDGAFTTTSAATEYLKAAAGGDAVNTTKTGYSTVASRWFGVDQIQVAS